MTCRPDTPRQGAMIALSLMLTFVLKPHPASKNAVLRQSVARNAINSLPPRTADAVSLKRAKTALRSGSL
jgi:hypothetical protein